MLHAHVLANQCRECENIQMCIRDSIDGAALTEMPETGETVKVHIIAAYNDEQSAVYTVGIFDSHGRLVKLEMFTPSATERYYPEFFEFEAKYDPAARIRIFTFEDIDLSLIHIWTSGTRSGFCTESIGHKYI